MGVVFFLGFLIILFFIALFIIAASIVVVIIWKVRKRKGKTPRKRWLVVPSVFLVVNILVALLPFAFWGFIRSTNNEMANKIVHVKSGVTIYWPIDDFYNTTTQKWFEMDGIKYVMIDSLNDENVYDNLENYELEDPIANIQSDPSQSNWFNEFMTWVGTGKTAKQLNVSAIYPVKNDKGLRLYEIKGNSGFGIYCADELN